MTMTLTEQLEQWMENTENERLEFKRAENSYDFEKLSKYCIALANEGGGKLILGITDKIPRQVIGSQAFPDLEKKKTELLNSIRLRIEAYVIQHPQGRVIVFDIPSRPIGEPLSYKGTFLMRSGESLVPMTNDQLHKIFSEAVPDYSKTICKEASFSDLSPEAIAELKTMWVKKSGNQGIISLSDSQLLEDIGLTIDNQVTYAALVLLGTQKGLRRHLAQAEVIFEYRSNEASIEYQARQEFHEGFFLFKDAIWRLLNLRNDIQHIQQGLFIQDIPTFNEQVVREAILNSVSHRDYQRPAPVFIRQFPRKLQVTSPGGFLAGINEYNILRKQEPRNRLIADVLMKCGLVERSGQGADKMFRESLREGKAKPSFQDTDSYQVSVTLHGEIQNPEFVAFIEKVSQENSFYFSVDDFLTLDAIYHEETLSDQLRAHIPVLVNNGLIEKVGKGRGIKYVLFEAFLFFSGQKRSIHPKARLRSRNP